MNAKDTRSTGLAGVAVVVLFAIALGILLSGCSAPPIGADQVTMQQAYEQVNASAILTGKPGADTVSILHRFDLDRLAAHHPEEAVIKLHQVAVTTGERDLLFALAETSYAAGEKVSRGGNASNARDARDYYLGAAIYSWLFLFGEAKQPQPGPFDRRFRQACDLYNYGLGLGLKDPGSVTGAVRLESGRRRLPVGEIELQFDPAKFTPSPFEEFEQVLLADQYRVRGLNVRSRDSGIGTPLICVPPANPELDIGMSVPATAVLHGPASLGASDSGASSCRLEVYSVLSDATVAIGTSRVPLEVDLTTFRAYNLTQSGVWKVGKGQFYKPAEAIPNRLILHEPFDPVRVPVIFVHGTFSSPVTWAEMANTLTADPILRTRYQAWSYVYASGNPVVQSSADFRTALTEQVGRVDPTGTNTILRQMVIVGHSQGGLVTKSTAVDNGDSLWRVLSNERFEDVKLSEKDRAEIRRLLFYEPLPFVSRVVFIATPHRGSYLSGGLARRLGQRVVALPSGLVSSGQTLLSVTGESEGSKFLNGKIPTSLDGMSPENPALLAMADIPVAPGVKAHSIIPVQGDDDYHHGRDGLVAYQSAHVDYVESELIVRAAHTCLKEPGVIEEVRRILHLHLAQLR